MEYKTTDNSTWKTYSTLSGSTTSETLTGLKNGEAYDIRVFADSDSTVKSTNSFTTTLPADDQPVLSTPAEGQITVDRETVTTNYGDVEIQYRENGTSTWNSTTVPYDFTTIDLTDLKDETEYEVRVRTKTEHTTSTWTDPVSATTVTPTVSLNGTVENLDGEPTANATVRIIGVNKQSLDVNPSKYESRADELLAEAENVTPPSWDPDAQLTGQNGLYRDGGTEYVAVHTKSDWELYGSQLPYSNTTGVAANLNTDLIRLGNPHVQVGADETIVLSVWDPKKEAIAEDSADSDLYGRTVPESRTIVVQQLGPGGDVISNSTRETQPMVEITNAANLGTKTHHGVALRVSTGFYRVYPQGEPEKAVVVAKGDSQSIISTWETELKNEAGEASARAQRLQDLIQEQKKLKTWTTQTNENGSWSQDIPADYITVSATAYKGPYQEMSVDPQNATVQDIRAFYESTDYNGSLALARSPKKISPPESDVTLTVAETTAPPRLDTDEMRKKLRDRFQHMLNRSLSEAQATFQQRLSELERDNLEESYQRLDRLRSANPRVDSRYQELLEEAGLSPTSDPPSEMSREELEKRVDLLDQAWYETSPSLSGTTSSEAQNQTVSAAMTLSQQVSEDAVTVIAHYSNGSSTAVPSEYIELDNGFAGTDDTTVRVNQFPVAKSDPAAVTFEFRVSTQDGIAKGRETVTNPQSAIDPPEIKSINVGSLEPGPDESVSVEIRPGERSTFGELTNVTVYGPDGSQLSTQPIEGGTETGFTTAGPGVHTIRLEYTSLDSDQTFVEVVRIQASGTSRDANPSVELLDTHAGVTPLVGDGISEAAVQVKSDGSVTVAPTITSDHPGTIDVFAQSVTTKNSDITVRLLKPDGSSYRKSVGIQIHTTKLTEEAYVYRNEKPITTEGTASGSRSTQQDQTLIQTYTDSGGEVTVEVVENPGLEAQVEWWYRTLSPFQPFTMVPILPLPTLPGGVPAAGAAAIAGAGGIARVRR